MNTGRLFDVAIAIVGVAFATAFLRSPNTAAVVNATTNGFANSIRAALGN